MDRDDTCTFIRTKVGQNVCQIRSDSGVSQSLLAKMIGVDRSHINRLERGKNNVSLDVLVKIADGLDVPITRLLAGLEDKPPRCHVGKKSNADDAGDC